MKIYLLHNEVYSLDKSLLDILQKLSIEFKSIFLPEQHQDIVSAFKDKSGGVIFLPGIWDDLYSVKVVQEINHLTEPFETVIVDKAPDIANLIVAFNEGLSAYLEAPFMEDGFMSVFARMKAGYQKKVEHIQMKHKLLRLETQSEGSSLSQSAVIRDQYLGKAFLDIIKKKGILFDSQVNILLVSSSQAQQNQLDALLKAVGLHTTKCHMLKEALIKVQEQEYKVIMADNVLSDGNSIDLVKQLRKELTKIPKVFVWSSSPEKTEELLKPEHHIDEVILKPSPDIGMEFILPSVINAIYQT